MPPSSSILSRYPALARASRLLDGPPGARRQPHDLFDLGCEITRMYARALSRESVSYAPTHMGDDASMSNRQDDLDRRGVAGD